jgi:hypothetical protein
VVPKSNAIISLSSDSEVISSLLTNFCRVDGKLRFLFSQRCQGIVAVRMCWGVFFFFTIESVILFSFINLERSNGVSLGNFQLLSGDATCVQVLDVHWCLKSLPAHFHIPESHVFRSLPFETYPQLAYPGGRAVLPQFNSC